MNNPITLSCYLCRLILTHFIVIAGLGACSNVKTIPANWEIRPAHVPMPPPLKWPIKGIAVMPSSDGLSTNQERSDYNYAEKHIGEILFNLKRYQPGIQITERKRLDEATREITLQMSGRVRDEEVVALGRMVGADHLLYYDVSFTQEEELTRVARQGGIIEAVVSARLVRIETGTVEYQATIIQSGRVPLPEEGRVWYYLSERRRKLLWWALRLLESSLCAAFAPKGNPGMAWQFNAKVAGIEVLAVLSGGPADKAGIRSKDIITRINGTHVNSLRKETEPLIQTNQQTLTVLRDGREQEIELSLSR